MQNKIRAAQQKLPSEAKQQMRSLLPKNSPVCNCASKCLFTKGWSSNVASTLHFSSMSATLPVGTGQHQRTCCPRNEFRKAWLLTCYNHRRHRNYKNDLECHSPRQCCPQSRSMCNTMKIFFLPSFKRSLPSCLSIELGAPVFIFLSRMASVPLPCSLCAAVGTRHSWSVWDQHMQTSSA